MPKFGDWESEENVEYSAYFEGASKAKGGEKIDPNDPRDKCNTFSDFPAKVQASAFKTELEEKAPKGPEKIESKHEWCRSQEDADFRMLNNQPHGHLRSYGKTQPEAPKHPDGLMYLIKQEVSMSKQKQDSSQEDGDPRRSVDSALSHESLVRRVTSDSSLNHQGGGFAGNGPLKAVRHSAVSGRSTENSPLHPHYQARVGGKGIGVSSPSWERKSSSQHSSHSFAPSTPGNSRLKPVAHSDETVNFSLALSLPRFPFLFCSKNC